MYQLYRERSFQSPVSQYHLAKELAGGAKRFVAEYDPLGRVVAVTPEGGQRRVVTPEVRAGGVRSVSRPTSPRAGSTSPDRLEAMRQDGHQLHRRYRGNLWAMVDDPEHRIRRCELAHESTIRARFAESSHPGATAADIRGYVRCDANGYEILISRSCPREERVLTVLHELGHVRGYALYDDGTEEPAIAWTRGWLSAG